MNAVAGMIPLGMAWVNLHAVYDAINKPSRPTMGVEAAGGRPHISSRPASWKRMVFLLWTMIGMLPNVAEVRECFQGEEEDGSDRADNH